eukprot:gene8121-14041_t
MDFIPPNKGQYEVGCTDLMTTSSFNLNTEDVAQNLQFGSENAKEIPGYFMRFFYPTTKESANTHERAKWIPKGLYADGFLDFVHLPTFILGRIARWLMGDAKMHALEDAPLLNITDDSHNQKSHKFPVVIFSHGLGANRTCYSSFCSDLASKGFFVAAVEHRDHSASATYYIDDNKEEKTVRFRKLIKGEDEFKLRNGQVTQRAFEMSAALSILTMLNSNTGQNSENLNVLNSGFDLSSLQGSLDFEKVAIAGHSFGGCTSLKTLAQDKRFHCAVILDAWMFPLDKNVYGKVEQPVLFINSETFHWKGNIKKISQIIGNDEQKQMLTIKGTGHHSQCDIPSIIPKWILTVFRMSATMSQDHAIDLQRSLMTSFFFKHLNLEKTKELECEGTVAEAVIEGTNLEITDEERESWYYKS